MTAKALLAVKEREHDADTTTVSQLLLDDVISNPGMTFLNGVEEKLLVAVVGGLELPP